MNKIYILFLCLCYAVSAIMANTYKNDKEVTSPTDANIFGHVVDKATGEHLPGITIILKGTTIGSVTDDSGHYMLKNLPEGEFTIEVSFVGFKTVTKKVTTGKGKTQELNFELEEDLISLEGVVVSANRNETKRRLAPTLVTFCARRVLLLVLVDLDITGCILILNEQQRGGQGHRQSSEDGEQCFENLHRFKPPW
mgnify:CR=1 FL=1